MDNGRTVRLTGDALGPDRLDYGYAATVNRTQGATGTTGRVLWDGGGREIAYVALSRTEGPTHIHIVAEDLDQAAEDLRRDWASERRQRWVLDTDALAPDGTSRHPHLHRRVEPALRAAQLRAERAALVATLPPDPTTKLREAERRATQIREQLDDLHAGTGRYANTAIGEAARRLRTAEHNHEQAQHSATAPGVSRRHRRASVRLVAAWSEELADAHRKWATVAGPTERQLLDALADAEDARFRLGAQRTLQALDRTGHGTHARIAPSTKNSRRSTAHCRERHRRTDRPRSPRVWVCRRNSTERRCARSADMRGRARPRGLGVEIAHIMPRGGCGDLPPGRSIETYPELRRSRGGHENDN